MAGEREAVENVAEVDHEAGDRGREWADAGGDELDSEEFHRAGVDDDGEDGCPPPREAGLDHDQAEGEAERDEAVRMGFFSPTIEKIYNLEIGDVTWQEREAANEGKFEAKPTANEVLGSSLKWDAARGQQLGTALNWWIALGVIGTVLTAGVAAFLSGAFERVPALQNVL